jgi:hypothetical protein
VVGSKRFSHFGLILAIADLLALKTGGFNVKVYDQIISSFPAKPGRSGGSPEKDEA